MNLNSSNRQCTHIGFCEAVVGIIVDEGHHGDTKLDGLKEALLRRDRAIISAGLAVIAALLERICCGFPLT